MLLNLVKYHPFLKVKKQQGKRFIFDPIRKKYLSLSPEEFVRQLLIQHLIRDRNYPPTRIAIEKTIFVNGSYRRFDLLVFDKNMKPFLLVECKTPEQKLNFKVFEQVSLYNSNLQVPYLLVCNGIEIHCCKMDYQNNSYRFLQEVPMYGGL